MPTSPIGPRTLIKGAIVAIDPTNPLTSVIIFQYNPHTLTRNLQARTSSGEEGARSEALRLNGAPIETIALEIELDATDQLERGDQLAGSIGIYPHLSALEMLLYPKSSLVIANTALAALGTIELVGAQAPLTLFIWGLKRVVPVRLTGLNIVEDAYDTQLNPIRARVEVTLRVLSYSDLQRTNPGYALFMTHQIVKETMAVVGSVNSLNAVGGGNVKLF
jgi:hypothetical protein